MTNSGTGLLDLPVQLRSRIWSLALQSSTPVYPLGAFDASQPPLTRVNKQVRAEALPIYYAQTKFFITTSSPYGLHRDTGASNWLARIGTSNSRYITFIHFDFGQGYFTLERTARGTPWRLTTFCLALAPLGPGATPGLKAKVKESISVLVKNHTLSGRLVRAVLLFLAWLVARPASAPKMLGTSITAAQFYQIEGLSAQDVHSLDWMFDREQKRSF